MDQLYIPDFTKDTSHGSNIFGDYIVYRNGVNDKVSDNHGRIITNRLTILPLPVLLG